MKYVGLYSQQVNNNVKSMLLLALFPTIILALTYGFYAVFAVIQSKNASGYYQQVPTDWEWVNEQFLATLPWVVGVVSVWFVIAYFWNAAMVRHSTGAHEVTRQENPRIYNIVENLTIACGMPMPKVNIMHSDTLNAFASGIDEKSYTVTVTTGLCDMLNDEELAGVIGHELTHIRNKDTRLLIISIIFVGIMSTIMSLAFRIMCRAAIWGGDSGRRDSKKGSGGALIAIMLVTMVMAAIGYLCTSITRFAISRKREYMADAGGAELCGNPLALASALRKISGNPGNSPKGRDDIAQLYIVHPNSLTSGIMAWFNRIFSTHPSIESRIQFLEQL